MKKKVSVFGNLLVKEDSLPLRILPELKKRFPEVEFVIEDPTESLNSSRGEWWILDSAEGIDDVVVLDDLSEVEFTNRISVHDYDLSFDLKLLQKLGRLKKLKIIAIPMKMNQAEAIQRVSEIISSS